MPSFYLRLIFLSAIVAAATGCGSPTRERSTASSASGRTEVATNSVHDPVQVGAIGSGGTSTIGSTEAARRERIVRANERLVAESERYNSTVRASSTSAKSDASLDRPQATTLFSAAFDGVGGAL